MYDAGLLLVAAAPQVPWASVRMPVQAPALAMVTDEEQVVEHPLAPVTVTVYVPLVVAVRLLDDPPLLQL